MVTNEQNIFFFFLQIIHAMEYVYQKKPEVEEREEADEEGEDSVVCIIIAP